MLSEQFGEPEQLKMFMSPREIVRQFRPGDAPSGPERAQLFSRKLAEARASGLHHSVAEEGVRQPIDLAHGEGVVLEGHHRLVSAMDTAPDRLIPVLHHETFKTYHRGWSQAEKAWPGR